MQAVTERCMDITSSHSSPSSSGASTGEEAETGPHEVEAGDDEQNGDGEDGKDGPCGVGGCGGDQGGHAVHAVCHGWYEM